jgi:hypothetical protein
MKKLLTTAFAVLALTVGSIEAIAQMGTANGTIVSSTPTAVVVRTEDGMTKTYVVDKTSILPSASLRVGDRVSVDYSTMTAGDLLVTRVTVVPGTATTTTTTSPGYSTTSTTSPGYSTTSNYSTTNDNYPDTAGNEGLLLLAASLGLAGAAALRLKRS